ncbi:MAG: HAD family hydrolase [Pseudobdellovibrionaceae bacterium]
MPDNVPDKPSILKPAAVFFDWDGTFVDTLPTIHHAYNHVLGAFGKPLMTHAEAKRRIRRSAREVFPEIFGPQSDEAFAMYYDVVGATHLDHLSAFDGGDALLRAIRARGITTGLVSNKRHLFLQEEVGHLGWADLFDVILGAGEAARDKPAPDPLLLATRKANLPPCDDGTYWYVGDTETDMMSASAAKFSPVFILHGLGTKDDCANANIEPYFVEDFQCLIRMVENFF